MNITHHNYVLLFFLLPGLGLTSCKWITGDRAARLQDTVLQITAENDLSEWITAEYYGEALYSHREAEAAWKREQRRTMGADTVPIQIADDLDLWKSNVMEYYEELHETLNYIWESLEKKKDKELEAAFQADYPEMALDPYHAQLREIIGERRERRFLQYVCLNSKNTVERGPLARFIKKNSSDDNPRDLVFLGRGWVKAGIDLRNVTRDSIGFNSEDRLDTLIIKGVYPRILNADINPWFIPRKSPGFEIIERKSTRSFSFGEVQRIKNGCKQRLVHDAIETGILSTAKHSAEEHVLKILHLLGYTEIKKVELKTSDLYDEEYLAHTYFDFGNPDQFTRKDTLVDAEELEHIEAMIIRNKTEPRVRYLSTLSSINKRQADLGLVDRWEVAGWIRALD